LGNWDHRLLAPPVPDSLRYRVLKEGKQRCALCGITARESVLDVDHIIPRSKGGKNDVANLQVLCSKCNRSKRDLDDTDFREIAAEADPDCPFCNMNEKRIIEKLGPVVAFLDGFPVTPKHTLIIPVRHTETFFSMTEQERIATDQLLRVLKKRYEENDRTITGFNVGSNSGRSAGQTIGHAHIHLIPRRDGDNKLPEGGVRGVIPSKQKYSPVANPKEHPPI